MGMVIPAAVLGMRLLETRRALPSGPIARVLPPPARQWDLLRIPLLGAILRYPHFRRGVQAVMLLLAAVVAVDGFFGTQVAPMNLAGVLPWTYWRGLAVIALLMAGELLCLAGPV